MKKWWATAFVLVGLAIVIGVVHFEISKRKAIIENGGAIYLPPDDRILTVDVMPRRALQDCVSFTMAAQFGLV
jgi:hypothetical protein